MTRAMDMYRDKAIEATIEAQVRVKLYEDEVINRAWQILKSRGIDEGEKIRIHYSDEDEVLFFRNIFIGRGRYLSALGLENLHITIVGSNVLEKSGKPGKKDVIKRVTLTYLEHHVRLEK